MSEKLDKKETVSVEELAMSNMYVQEALVNLLTRKGDPDQRGDIRGNQGNQRKILKRCITHHD